MRSVTDHSPPDRRHHPIHLFHAHLNSAPRSQTPVCASSHRVLSDSAAVSSVRPELSAPPRSSARTPAMPAPATFHDFLDVCRKSGVVEESSPVGHQRARDRHPRGARPRPCIRAGALTKFQADQLLAGKYKGLRFDRLKILDQIGAGGMGPVFLCEHLGLRRQVAVKVLPPDQAGDEAIRERFYREARAAAALDHPNIVRVYDMTTAGGVHYLVMEYVEGQDLQTILNKHGAAPVRPGLHVHRPGRPRPPARPREGARPPGHQAGQPAGGPGRGGQDPRPGAGPFNATDEQDKLTARVRQGGDPRDGRLHGPGAGPRRPATWTSGPTSTRSGPRSTPCSPASRRSPGAAPRSWSGTPVQSRPTSPDARSAARCPKGLSAVVARMMAKNPADRYQTPAEVVDALTPWLEADTIPLDAQQTRKMSGPGR